MEDFIYKIKNECATAYFAASSPDIFPKGFDHLMVGCDLLGSADLYSFLGYIENHYSRSNITLPKGFRLMMHNRTGHKDHRSLGNFTFHVAHYTPNQRKLEKKAKNLERLYVRTSELGIGKKSFDSQTWLHNLNERFGKVGVITPYFQGKVHVPTIVGNKELTQEIMDRMKSDKDSVYEIFRSLSAHANLIDRAESTVKEIKLYDIVKRPRQVSHRMRL